MSLKFLHWRVRVAVLVSVTINLFPNQDLWCRSRLCDKLRYIQFVILVSSCEFGFQFASFTDLLVSHNMGLWCCDSMRWVTGLHLPDTCPCSPACRTMGRNTWRGCGGLGRRSRWVRCCSRGTTGLRNAAGHAVSSVIAACRATRIQCVMILRLSSGITLQVEQRLSLREPCST